MKPYKNSKEIKRSKKKDKKKETRKKYGKFSNKSIRVREANSTNKK